MKNLKICLANESQNREAQELFFNLGAYWYNGDNVKEFTEASSFDYPKYIHTNEIGRLYYCAEHNSGCPVSLPELRDLIVLKRNDVGDATHIGKSGSEYYKASEYFCFWNGMQWKESSIDFIENDLKPIEKEEMKQQEYLVKNTDGKYFLTTSSNYPDGIKVPEGAEIYALANDGNYSFWSGEYQWADGEITRDIKEDNPKFTFKEWSLVWDAKILWQRNNPEELKSIGFDLGVEDGDKSVSIENPFFPDFVLSEPVVENNDFNGLDKSEINHRVAKSFNVIRGTDLNEDDIHFLRELIDLTTSHYWDRK